MKTIICITLILLMCASASFSQSVLDFQTGTTIVIQPGADVCADNVIINGTLSGGGTICGGLLFTLNLTAFIEGFYNSTTNRMVSDTVRVYLRNATTPYTLVDSAQSILSPLGFAKFYFAHAVNGTNYYLVLQHRNSIETWSSTGQAFTTATLTYNFSTAADKAFGNNQTQVDTSPLRFAIYGGDVTQEGSVDAADLTLVDNAVFNFVTGYVNTDLTGNNAVDAADLTIVDNNAFDFVTKKTPPLDDARESQDEKMLDIKR